MRERLDIGPVQIRGSAPRRPRQQESVVWLFSPFNPILPRLLAAALAVVVLIFAARVLPPPSQQPEVNLPAYDLFPPGSLRGGGEESPKVRIPEDALRFVLFLHTEKLAGFHGPCEVVVSNASREVWQGRNLRPDTYGTFNLVLPRDFLDPGKYKLDLVGHDEGGRPPPVASFSLDFGYQ